MQSLLPLAVDLNDEVSVPLCSLELLKATKAEQVEGEPETWRFAGVASDESRDVDGDEILKKHLDLSYAQSRGYVNWDHSRAPADQLGFLEKAVLITDKNRKKLGTELGVDIPDTASVYVEGELYQHVPKAGEVHQILKSSGKDRHGLGISLDGVMARDAEKGGIVKAYVRGVALTPVPAHPKTIARLRKSLSAYRLLEDGETPADLVQAITDGVVEELRKSAGGGGRLTRDEAILFLLRKRPKWNYDLASKVVQFTVRNQSATGDTR